MARIYGDPQRVGEEVVRAELEKAEKALREAYETSARLLDDKRRTLARKAVERAREAYMEALERVRSEEAKLELELRTRVAAEKNKYLDRLMERVAEELKKAKAGAAWYEAYMRRVFERLASEAREYGRLIVRVAGEDQDLARRLALEAGPGLLEVDPEPADIIGGALASTEDGSVSLDYTLDLLLREEEARLRSIASKILFG